MRDPTLYLFPQTPDAPPSRARASLPDSVAQTHVPSQSRSITSTVAAINVAACAAPRTQLGIVRDFVCARGPYGATREEIADATGLRLSAVCGRANTLYRQGRIGSNPGCTRRGSAKALQEVLVDESLVERWRGVPRRLDRTMLDGSPCDLVDPITDRPISESRKKAIEDDHL